MAYTMPNLKLIEPSCSSRTRSSFCKSGSRISLTTDLAFVPPPLLPPLDDDNDKLELDALFKFKFVELLLLDERLLW